MRHGRLGGVNTIRDRIKELRRVPARELVPHAKNWRTHPEPQKAAMRAVLDEVGWAERTAFPALPLSRARVMGSRARDARSVMALRTRTSRSAGDEGFTRPAGRPCRGRRRARPAGPCSPAGSPTAGRTPVARPALPCRAPGAAVASLPRLVLRAPWRPCVPSSKRAKSRDRPVTIHWVAALDPMTRARERGRAQSAHIPRAWCANCARGFAARKK